MKKDMCRYMYAKGSYTVEAALVFPVILLVLAAMLYLIFYLHDEYILCVYSNRMARECCWLYIENEHEDEKRSSNAIIEAVAQKYEPELEDQLLMMELTTSLGTCKKNILTHLYTATWKLVGKPVFLNDVSPYLDLSNIICEGEYARVHIRKWIYSTDALNELLQGGGEQ